MVRTRVYLRREQQGPGEDGADQEGTRTMRSRYKGLGGYKRAVGLEVAGKG